MVATPTFPSSHAVVLVTAGIPAPLGLSSVDLGDSPHVLVFQFESGANCGPVRLPRQFPYV
jgi:hypothetical protein